MLEYIDNYKTFDILHYVTGLSHDQKHFYHYQGFVMLFG